MGNLVSLCIEFLSPETAALYIETSAPDGERQFAELLLFTSLALRQLHNLGTIHPVTRSLAKALQECGDTRIPLTTLLGPPDLSLKRLTTSLASGAPEPFSNYVSVDIVKIVRFSGQKGKKRFLATLNQHGDLAVLRLDPKGFDLLGAGVNYYAPLSVGILLHQLALSRREGAVYLRQLLAAARSCGTALLRDQISVLSQPSLAYKIVKDSVGALTTSHVPGVDASRPAESTRSAGLNAPPETPTQRADTTEAEDFFADYPSLDKE